MKQGTSFRLSKEALDLLREISKDMGLSQASTLEVLIRDKARENDLHLRINRPDNERGEVHR